jgi:antitoxin (DNA-binding transcriptional repressor) of toxin-antitoxin stability system
MTSIPMPEFNQDWQAALLKVRQGETVVILENGKPVAQLSPAATNAETSEEPKPAKQNGLLWMCELGEKLIPPGPVETLTNEEMDRIIYDH